MRQVYNMTPYLAYHPGGIADLMLSAGGDCTDLFNEKHAWVNGHSMLEVRVFLPTTTAWTDGLLMLLYLPEMLHWGAGSRFD